MSWEKNISEMKELKYEKKMEDKRFNAWPLQVPFK